MQFKNEMRPSASVIIVAKSAHTTASNDHNYEVLLFQRSPSTAYFQDHFVFPGGAFDRNADESLDWLEYFHKCGISTDHFKTFRVPQSNRPHPLLTTGVHFSRDISLRITAIRETFEEVGILLCRRPGFQVDCAKGAGYGFAFENIDERSRWQKEVHRDASKFLQLCRHFKVVPDVWALHEWSVWRSSSTASRKFDTVYYLVALEEQPSLLLEKSEAETSMWLRPREALKMFKDRSIWLPPLQVYELCRLSNAPNLVQLLRFSVRRARNGCSILMPCFYRTDEGYRVATLIGDDYYPRDPSIYDDSIPTNSSYLDFQRKSKHFHRIVLYDMYDFAIESNIPPVDGHLSPLPNRILKSKL